MPRSLFKKTSPKASPFWEGTPRFRRLASKSLSESPALPILPGSTHRFIRRASQKRIRRRRLLHKEAPRCTAALAEEDGRELTVREV